MLAGFSELLSQAEIASICGAIKIEIEIVFRLLECHVLVKETKCAIIKAESYQLSICVIQKHQFHIYLQNHKNH